VQVLSDLSPFAYSSSSKQLSPSCILSVSERLTSPVGRAGQRTSSGSQIIGIGFHAVVVTLRNVSRVLNLVVTK
jgi:hypothetical protein